MDRASKRISPPIADQQSSTQAPSRENTNPRGLAAAREGVTEAAASRPVESEEPSFLSEMTAGLLGYARSAVLGDTPDDYTFSDPVRTQFQEDLESGDIPATLARQLQNQNYMQDKFGNGLPPEAAAAMLENAAQLKDVLETGDRTDSALAHSRYMLDTIPSFTENGSSSAPAVLHRMGVAWQTPGVAADTGHLLREPRSLVERVGSLFGDSDQER